MSETLVAYRLVKRKWRSQAFTGHGARLYGGRWNSRGTPCVYVSASQSLAVLEVMVHINDYRLLNGYTMWQIMLPVAQLERLNRKRLPTNWREEPAPADTADIGDGWLNNTTALALDVPSVVLPGESNYLLNISHPAYADIVRNSVSEINFQLDQRLIN